MLYEVGSPLFALPMTKLDMRAVLYASLRVLIYQGENATTRIEHDKPTTLFEEIAMLRSVRSPRCSKRNANRWLCGVAAMSPAKPFLDEGRVLGWAAPCVESHWERIRDIE